MEGVGVDVIEFNIYYVFIDLDVLGIEVEKNYFDIVKVVKDEVKIFVVVKILFFFSNMVYMVKKFVDYGVDGLVLFNCFY